jgi:RNA polymerase sigma-70 factor, ECF subfamily
MGQTHLLDPDGLGDHRVRLYRAARVLCGSHERAEDLVQDTYARVLARPRLLRSDDDLAYLLRVLRNTFISQLRRSRADRLFAEAEELEHVEDPATPQPYVIAESRLVYEAIGALPLEFREALVAVDVAGFHYHEAARALHIREGTLTSRLFRARRRVAEALQPVLSPAGSFSPAEASFCS